MKMRNHEMDAGSAVSALRDGATKGKALAPKLHLRSPFGKIHASRLALPMALVLGATLSGCGPQQSGAAATVNNSVIRDQDVQTVTGQLNTLAEGGQKITANNVLISLILSPYVLAEAKRAGKTVSPSRARQVIAKMADPSPATIRFVQMQLEVQQLDQASKTTIVKELSKAKVTVNPRYGTFDPSQIVITPPDAPDAIPPNWIKAGASSPAK
jgi:hypothetical protein